MSLTRDIYPSPIDSRKYITNRTLVTHHNDTEGGGVAQKMRFKCQPGCTECCRQQGFVYLSEADLARAAKFVGLSRAAFERKYVHRTRNRMRLRVPRQSHCHFLFDGGCSIHEAKPTQ